MQINSKTKVVGIIGHPVEHSLSPLIHNACFEELGLPFVYVAFDVTDLENAINGIRALGIRGVSVTIPHKISAIKYLDRIEGIAEKIGAINTIINDCNKLIGYNTDAYGIAAAFKESGITLSDKNCLILGSGGAGRASAFVVCESNPKKLDIISIETDQLKILLEDIKRYYKNNVQGLQWTEESLKKAIASADIIINATPVGMSPKVDECPIDPSLLKSGQTVFDVIYTPPETKLLSSAKKAGCKTISGVEMFIHQGVEQFRLFTGVTLKVEIFRRAFLRCQKKMNIVLIGYRGSGKSTVARILSKNTGMERISTDAVIEERAGMTISEYVKKYGWPAFRNLEAEVVAEVAERNGVIIDTGGGVVLRRENIESLKKKGVIFFLTAEPRILAERIKSENTRPSLKEGKTPWEEVEEVLKERLPFYESAADFKFDTGSTLPEDIARRIIQIFYTQGKNNNKSKKLDNY